MNARRRSLHSPGHQRGQAMVEYLLGAALVVALLAIPIDGYSSVVAMLLDAVRIGYAKFLAALSIPY